MASDHLPLVGGLGFSLPLYYWLNQPPAPAGARAQAV